MLYSFFKSFLRNISRNRGTFIINILGLTLGLSTFVFIALFVVNEFSFDKHHKKSDRIYRLAVQAMIGDTRIDQTFSSVRVLNEISERYPEIKNAVKLTDAGASTIKVGDMVFNEEQTVFSDSTYFDLFSTPMIDGEFERPLARPNTMIISRSCAERYFGKESAIGKIVELNNRFLGITPFSVVGVYEDMPANSHFHFDYIATNFTYPTLIDATGWSNNNFITYLLLEEGASSVELENKLEDYVAEHIGNGDAEQYESWIAAGNFWRFYLQPLADIHLKSDLNGEWESNGNLKYVLIFAAIGLFVLLIACINFINLSTAKSTLRAREVGVRKVSGSTREMLVVHFIWESVLITFLSLILALSIVLILLPFYSNWLERDFSLLFFGSWLVIPGIIAFGLIISIINGLYPAFVLSSFAPSRVLKGETSGRNRGIALRNVLVIVQFAASIFLIISTLVVNRQLSLIQKADLGFSKKNVIIINTSPEIYPALETYINELKHQAGVLAVSASNTLPGFGFNNWGFRAEGIDNSFTLNVLAGDYEFINTMKFKIAEGRYFQLDHPSDSSAALLNETAVKVLGLENPIGIRISNNANNPLLSEVVGVIEDFHYESLHSEIRPMVLVLQGGIFNSNVSYLTVKYVDGSDTEIISRAESLWNEMAPGVPFIHSYFEEDYMRLYNNEEQTRQVFSIMALLSIIVACLGLFGLASFISQQRAKEVAVRKVFGSSIGEVLTLLSKKYSLWIIISFVIACPLAFWVMSRWLQNFSYKITIGPIVFILSLIIALFLALITIGGNINRAARANPAETLRHE